VHVGEEALQVSASIGGTFYPQAEEADADQLLRLSDQAIYQAKLVDMNRYHVFAAEQNRSLRGCHDRLLAHPACAAINGRWQGWMNCMFCGMPAGRVGKTGVRRHALTWHRRCGAIGKLTRRM
jgi:predicted signal transduction protein with EAL and GGDEF domain